MLYIHKSSRPFLINSFSIIQGWVVRSSFCTPSVTYLRLKLRCYRVNLKVSLNVRGISNFKKRRAICTWCRKQKADFDVLQETHSMKETEVQWKNEWGGEIPGGGYSLIWAI